jgi:hypothetical protein
MLRSSSSEEARNGEVARALKLFLTQSLRNPDEPCHP